MRVNTATKARHRILPSGEADISCYQSLANAIILQAVKDYKAELHKLLKNPNSREAMGKAMDIERFFHSPWYAMLTNVAPDVIIDGVRKQIKEEAEIKRRRRMKRLQREAAEFAEQQKMREASLHASSPNPTAASQCAGLKVAEGTLCAD